MKKIATKYTCYIVAVIVAVTFVFMPLYFFVQKQGYLKTEIRDMAVFFEELTSKIDFSDHSAVSEYIEENNEKHYVISIYDNTGKRLYSSEKHRKRVKSGNTDSAGDSGRVEKIGKIRDFQEYQTSGKPNYIEKDEEGMAGIFLKEKVSVQGQVYYIYIRERLKNIQSVFDYTNRMMMIILILYILVSVIAMFILMRGLTKSVRTLNDVVKKISQKDYSVRYEGKITKDEVGTLAGNFNEMVDVIQDSITSIHNYNFILKEDLEHIKEYEELRNSFVRDMTHELKTPLMVISSQVEMMNCTGDEEKRQYYYQSAMEEIGKMSRLITNLLQISVAERHVLREKACQINMSEKILSLCEKMTPVMRTKRIQFTYEIEKNCVQNFTETHLEHIFSNYMMNAIRCTREGGIIKTTFQRRGKGYLLSIYNEGDRIPEEETEKIWAKFYSVHADEMGNTGLGLFIVKEIARLYHLDCGMKNHAHGVEFWFDFFERELSEENP